MSTHQDMIQGAIVRGITMVSALRNGTGNALVGVAAHFIFLLLLNFNASMRLCDFFIHFPCAVAFFTK